ncbi:hypothetical protein [Algibacillus agarilyticus]|uniref:hypothetical protein n=1 Tax=Algibacillus agarilyticus TaxID=2234133 RepID=UPI000DD0228E|nr:hypothetical protein [Algibacillus agarilyticus]
MTIEKALAWAKFIGCAFLAGFGVVVAAYGLLLMSLAFYHTQSFNLGALMVVAAGFVCVLLAILLARHRAR